MNKQKNYNTFVDGRITNSQRRRLKVADAVKAGKFFFNMFAESKYYCSINALHSFVISISILLHYLVTYPLLCHAQCYETKVQVSSKISGLQCHQQIIRRCNNIVYSNSQERGDKPKLLIGMFADLYYLHAVIIGGLKTNLLNYHSNQNNPTTIFEIVASIKKKN